MWRTLRRILDVLGEGLRRAKGRPEAVLPKDRPQGIFSDRSVLRWDFRNVGLVSVAVHSCGMPLMQGEIIQKSVEFCYLN